MTIRLIALDIDGTLLPPGAHHTALPDQFITETISNLIQAGVQVVLASGRMYPGTAHIANHLGTNLPLICQQGASIHETNGELIRGFTIDQEIAQELVAFAQAGSWPFAWFDAHRYLVSTPNKSSQHFADVSGVEIEHHEAPHNSGIVATGIDIISTSAEAPEIHQALAARYGDRIELLDFTSVTAAHSPQASKGNALASLAADLGVDAAEVLAIGDSVNDVSMLTWSGHGAAPTHCDKYARAAADEILPGSGVRGVWQLLQKVLQELD